MLGSCQLHIDRLTLDFDSTVMTRYGQQQGTRRGYNPQKPGRVSHHPLMAFVADTQMVANLWLRPGNTGSAHNVKGFLADTVARLGGKPVGLLRADSGFSHSDFLHTLEQQKIPYIIALRLQQPLQRALVAHKAWWALNEPCAQGIEIASFDYHSPVWDTPRRIVAVRQHIHRRDNARGKTLSLFGNDPEYGQYRYAVYVTDLALPAQAIWAGIADAPIAKTALKSSNTTSPLITIA